MELIEPTIKYKTEYLEYLEDWHSTKEKLVPFTSRYDVSNFEAFIEKINSFKIVKDTVHHSTFWLLDEGKIIAVSNLRHYLNDQLLLIGGHIGYGVRPSCRRKGYATKILELTLLEAKNLGIEKALITCNTENIGSSKTIERNGGQLWKRHEYEGKELSLYWIKIPQ